MQPTFLPWAGYIKMIELSDLFIFLDDVQFNKRSFQCRNKILINKKEKLLSVPVNVKNKYNQLINEVEINYDKNWSEKFLKSIYLNYSKHKYFDEIYDFLKTIILDKDFKLIDLNYKLIFSICNYLDIKTNFEFSSKYKVKKKKSEKILGLIIASGGTEYLTPETTKNYLGDGEILKENNIKVSFFNYKCKEYEQKNTDKFISHLSIIDLLFNFGKDSKNFL